MQIIFEKTLEWLAKSINSSIEIRKEDLKGIRGGAIRANYPQLIWVKMPVRPFIKNTNKGYVFAQCHTFNNILVNTIAKFPGAATFEIDMSPSERHHFDLQGNLSPLGYEKLWKEISHGVKQLDKPEALSSPDRKQKNRGTPQSTQHFGPHQQSLEYSYHAINIDI